MDRDGALCGMLFDAKLRPLVSGLNPLVGIVSGGWATIWGRSLSLEPQALPRLGDDEELCSLAGHASSSEPTAHTEQWCECARGRSQVSGS